MYDVYHHDDATALYQAAGGGGERARTPVRLLISAAVFGALFSYLFTNQRPGLNVFLFVLLLYAFALVNKAQFMKRTFREEKLISLFSLPVIFLAAYFFISGTFLNALSLLVILFVMFVQYMVLSDNALYRWYEPLFLLDLLFGGINRLFMGLGQFTAGSVNSIFKKQSEKKKGAVIGALIGIALLILIIPLLLMADPAVAVAVNLFFAQINIGDAFLFIFMFLLGASAAAAPVATANRGEYTGLRTAKDFSALRPVQGVTAGVALSMVGAVYILFGTAQFAYFFETKDTMAKILGLTSSQYAVRGFAELLFVTCLNFIIIAAALRFTKRKENGSTQGYIKALCTLLVVFNFVIMASSHMRLTYYETSYGYTIARFISHSFMILLVILNAIMLGRVYLEKIKLIKVFAVCALVYFCGLVALNPETYVVRSNIERFEQTGKIDTAYMFTLSGDAVPMACDFFEVNPQLYDRDAEQAARDRYEEYARIESCGWQSYNAAEHTAHLKLRELLLVPPK